MFTTYQLVQDLVPPKSPLFSYRATDPHQDVDGARHASKGHGAHLPGKPDDDGEETRHPWELQGEVKIWAFSRVSWERVLGELRWFNDISGYLAKHGYFHGKIMGKSWVLMLFESCLKLRMVIFEGYDGR